MSQHSDLLTYGISKGLRNKNIASVILADVGDLLSVLEYEDSWCAGPILKQHVYDHARWMRTQRDGLYGISHKQLDDFLHDLEFVSVGLDFL